MLSVLLAIIFVLIFGQATAVAVIIERPIERQDERLILDVDAGTDDAIALSIALQAEKSGIGPPVIAVTCVQGNTLLANVLKNVARILDANDRTDIPFYAGASESLVYTEQSDDFFGSDGLGDVHYDGSNLILPKKEHAVLALIRLVNKYPGQIVIISTGPLTNIALVKKLDQLFFTKVKKIYILGGTVSGIGNVKPGIEFNSYADTEAFYVGLTSVNSSQATLLPFDPVMKNYITREWWKATFDDSSKKVTRFLNRILEQQFKSHSLLQLGDPILCSSYIMPEVAKRTEKLLVSVVTDGKGRGVTLVDFHHRFDNNGTNLNVIMELDIDAYKELLTDLFS